MEEPARIRPAALIRQARHRITPIAIASAPSVPGAGDSHSSANFVASE
jgi:hypothetical protein